MKTEVVYTKAPVGKRMYAHLIDVLIFIFTGIILFTISNISIKNFSFYKQNAIDLHNLREDSCLYVDDQIITTYVQDDEKFPNTEDKKDELRWRILEFYNNPTYFSDVSEQMAKYDKRRLDALNESTHLFIRNDEGIVVENTVEAQLLYDFYVAEVSDYSIIALYQNSEYIWLLRFSFIATVVQIVIASFISFAIYYVILPTTVFRRGRQTIGMKLNKIAIISIHAVNETLPIYLLRSLFMYIVFVPVNVASFLVPTFISLGMMHFTQTNSSLVNYIFNDYIVDIKDQDIYLNDLERIDALNNIGTVSLKNKEIELK